MNLNEKIKGALYGMALGNALGLGTEFMTQSEIKSYYPSGLTSFDQFIRDMHRSMYRPGQWTNDTEIILRMLEAIIEKGRVDIQAIARNIRKWYDEHPDELEAPYRIVIPSEGWEENPIVVSHRAWRSNQILEASNEPLNRALIIGIFADETTPLSDLATRLVNMTHDDSRCVATTAAAAMYVKALMFDETEPDYHSICDLCRDIDERTLQYVRLAHDGKLKDFKIDDEETWWYSRKCLGVALWALWNCNSPQEILDTLVHAGGDTDTNASLAMMIAGIKYGYDALPDLKLKILDHERLDRISERLTALVEKRIK